MRINLFQSTYSRDGAKVASGVSVRFYLMIYLCFVGVVVTSNTPKKKTGTKGQSNSKAAPSHHGGVKKSKHSHRKNAMREPSSSGKTRL